MSRSTLIVGLLVAIGGMLAWPLLWRVWFAFVDGASYTTSVPWLDKAMLLFWGVAFTFFTLAGAVFVILARPKYPVASGAVVGAVVGALSFLMATHVFTEHATISAYMWMYGAYAVVPAATLCGSMLAARVLREHV